MPKLYRLLARAEIDGAVREPGYVFALPLDLDGNEILGPHKTVEHGHDVVDMAPDSPTNGQRVPGLVKDVPLYEEILEGAPGYSNAADTAMGGGTRKMDDERRLAELNGATHLGEAERAERDALARQIATSRAPQSAPPMKDVEEANTSRAKDVEHESHDDADKAHNPHHEDDHREDREPSNPDEGIVNHEPAHEPRFDHE